MPERAVASYALKRELLEEFAAQAVFDRKVRVRRRHATVWVLLFRWRGETHSLAEWAALLNVSYSYIAGMRARLGRDRGPDDGVARNHAGRRTQGTCVACLRGPHVIMAADRCGGCYERYRRRRNGLDETTTRPNEPKARVRVWLNEHVEAGSRKTGGRSAALYLFHGDVATLDEWAHRLGVRREWLSRVRRRGVV